MFITCQPTSFLAGRRSQACTFFGPIALGGVKQAEGTAITVGARGLPVALALAAGGLAVLLSVGQGLASPSMRVTTPTPVTEAQGVDWNWSRSSLRIYSAISWQSVKSLATMRSLMSGGRRRKNMAINHLLVRSSSGMRVSMCLINSVGFMLLMLGRLKSSNTISYLDLAKPWVRAFLFALVDSLTRQIPRHLCSITVVKNTILTQFTLAT